jgi:hypothetical protein
LRGGAICRDGQYPDITEHAADVNVINLGIFMIASNYQYVDERQ